MMARLRALAASGRVHVAFAFVAMGGWAVFANRVHPMPRPLLSGIVQGAVSALLTLCLKSIIDTLSRRFSGGLRFWVPPLLACLVTTGILLAIHALAGTPEILPTIAMPLFVSTSYAVVYSGSIFRQGAR